MNWADFGPYVMPHVTGVPLPMLEHHARMAAIEFCERTKCWARRLDPIMTTGTVDIDLLPDVSSAMILDVEDVAVDGVKWPVVSAGIGIAKSRETTNEKFCFTEDLAALLVYPLQSAGAAVVVSVSMAPKPDAADMHADIAHYAYRMSHGVIASLMRVPGQSFTSPLADVHESMFRENIKIESARLARGSVATGGGRIQPSFI